MNITIIGAGAMGSLFGGLLAEAGSDVRLLDIWVEHVNAIKENGLSIERDGSSRRVSVQATTDKGRIGQTDLAIIFVKSNQTADAAKSAKALVGNSGYVLSLQNGLGNADLIADTIAPEKVVGGTTSHGATLLGPGRIRHAGGGPTTIGLWGKGDEAHLEKIARVLTRAGIQTACSQEIRQVIWDKLLVNVGINAITALTHIKNGELLDLDVTKNLSKAAVEEAIAVAEHQGIPVRKDAVDHVLAIASATAGNRSSMGQDVDNGRVTEISAINGAVVKAAERAGLQAPVNQTLTALIETLQAHYS